VAAPAHDRLTLARFQDGEQRLVYARRKDQLGGPLYFLKDDTAADLKAWAKEHLECFLPNCPDRRLTTVARRGKRDGFKHNSGAGGHGREGLFHEQGKAFFERWVRERYPHVQVVLEQATRSKERRADVMLTWPNGAQVAVEVQYAAISPQEWQHRHDSYRNQGIVDVWLFGHIAPHLRQTRPPTGEHISLQPVHYAVVEAGMPLLWINPILELVATAWQAVEGSYDRSSRGKRYEVPPVWSAWRDPVALFRPVALSECELSPTGLMFSFLNGLITAGQRLQEALARQERARQERLERARADEAKKEEQAAAKLAEFHRWWDPRESAWQLEWEQSDDHAWLVQKYGKVPDVISRRLETFGGVLAYHEHWHTVLYHMLVCNKRPKEYWSLVDARITLRSAGLKFHPTNPERVEATLFAFICQLADAGHVQLLQSGRTVAAGTVPGTVGAPLARVVGDIGELLAQQRMREQLAAQKLQTPAPAAVPVVEHHRRLVDHQARIVQARAAVQSRPVRMVSPPRPAVGLSCAGCGGGLDLVFIGSGRHIGC